jgi:8-oxo-dGTP diphosphatase
MKTVDIVIGVIFKNNKFLIEKRKQNEKIDPGLAVFPSGHVNPKETREEALKREMKEELNIKVKRMKFIKKDFWIASNRERQNLYYYLILDYEGEPICKTAKELIWTKNVDELDTDVDRRVIEDLNVK